MKRHLNTLMAIIILVGAFAVSAHAQANSSTQKVIANIPFAFNVGNVNLPAGKYAVTVVNPASDRKILQIRSSDGRWGAMILTNGVSRNASDDAKLVFHRYGDRYFFAKAQMAGEPVSLAAVKSSAERQQESALAAVKKSMITIVAE